MRHLRFGSSVKKCVARVVDGVVDLLLRGKRYLKDLKFFTLGGGPDARKKKLHFEIPFFNG